MYIKEVGCADTIDTIQDIERLFSKGKFSVLKKDLFDFSDTVEIINFRIDKKTVIKINFNEVEYYGYIDIKDIFKTRFVYVCKKNKNILYLVTSDNIVYKVEKEE